MFDILFILFYNDLVKHLLQPFRFEGAASMRNRIKEYREKKGISQGELADRCRVSRQTINAIENNKYDPSLQLAFNLAKILGTKVDSLFLNEEEME